MLGFYSFIFFYWKCTSTESKSSKVWNHSNVESFWLQEVKTDTRKMYGIFGQQNVNLYWVTSKHQVINNFSTSIHKIYAYKLYKCTRFLFIYCFYLRFSSTQCYFNIWQKKKELNSGQSKYTIICTICKKQQWHWKSPNQVKDGLNKQNNKQKISQQQWNLKIHAKHRTGWGILKHN